MLTRRGVSQWRAILLTIEAWLGLAAFDLALWAGFARAHQRVRESVVKPEAEPLPVDEVVWAVDEACVWYVKRALCLQRSAVTTRLLRRHGTAATLVIGYRAIPFESHAWVEVDHQVVNDRPQYKSRFTVLERL